jgi:hypothetical protein
MPVQYLGQFDHGQGLALARIFHKAPDFSPPAGFLGKNRFGSRHFFCSAAQQGAIASYVKQKGRF